ENCTSSSYRTVKVAGTGSIHNTPLKDFTMWPNPSTGVIMIDNQNSFAQVAIRNHLGQEVYKGNVIRGLNQIDLSSANMSTGIFIVTLTFEDATMHQQLVYR
ncbi:MAG: T9SS type A sorting domain-containing protein, partial [Bacteroidia bacterium]|nr:T9SS type A sorting domain-containing protein [Bacteroidia bacterium]